MNETNNKLNGSPLVLVREYEVSEDRVVRLIPPRIWMDKNGLLSGSIMQMFENPDTGELVIRKKSESVPDKEASEK